MNVDIADLGGSRTDYYNPLEMIARVVPFESFCAEIEAAVLTPASEKKSPAGRKPIDVMVMFRMLVVQSLYNLSDEQVEYQVRDRLSFTRFVCRKPVWREIQDDIHGRWQGEARPGRQRRREQ
jgi:hypothetical protein